MLTRPQIAHVLQSPRLTPGEKKYIEFQYHLAGDFYTALWGVIARADENNLFKLAQGFPGEVAAYKRWTRGDLAQLVDEVAEEVPAKEEAHGGN